MNVASAIEKLARRVPEVYLHIDMDCLDADVAPGVVEAPVPGGLSLQDLRLIILDAFAHFRVKAVSLAVYNPERDQDDKTLRAGLQIIDSIAECVATMK